MDSTGANRDNVLKKSSLALKYIIKNMRPINYDINGDMASRKFVNVNEDYGFRNDNDLKRKIRKLLD